MSFGQNLQFLRRMRNDMTQEVLAEKLGVSRQTISKWELDAAYPEMDKLVELCNLFFCTMDELVRGDMNISTEAYSDVRAEEVDAFRYISYIAVSTEPESDAISHAKQLAEKYHISEPKIIGWDFPFLSQEQINVYNMHGYTAALILPDEVSVDDKEVIIRSQEKQKYMVITIRFSLTTEGPFVSIPNAYKVLMTYMHTNQINPKKENIIPCFEKEYTMDGEDYMDIYIAAE